MGEQVFLAVIPSDPGIALLLEPAAVRRSPIFQVWWSRAFNLLQPSHTFATVPKAMPVERPTGPASLKTASIFCCRWPGENEGRGITMYHSLQCMSSPYLPFSHYSSFIIQVWTCTGNRHLNRIATNCSITKWLWVEAASIRTSYSSPGCWVFMVTWGRVQSFESLRS